MAQCRLEVGDRLAGLLFVQRQGAHIIFVAPPFVPRPAPWIGHILIILQKPAFQPCRLGSLASFQRQEQLAPDGALRIPGLVLGSLFRAAEIPLPPVHLRQAAVADRARRIRPGHLNVALVLAESVAVAALLEVDVTEVNNGWLKFRIERQGGAVLAGGTLLPSGLLNGHAQAVVFAAEPAQAAEMIERAGK